MSNKESEDFYRSLSRKELQSMCKKYGLPARKSSSEMAGTLFSYFQMKNLSFARLGKSTGGIQDVLLPPSSLTALQVEVPSTLTGHVIKDSWQLKPCRREEGNKGNIQITCNELESCMELRAHDKEFFCGSIHQDASQSQFVSHRAESGVIHKQPCSGRTEHAPQCQRRCGNESVCLKENILAVRSYTKDSPSFEFHASSEEGIKLCVDLSSSPLDWIKKYKNQVSFCNNADNAKSGSLQQELGRIGESSKQIKSSFPQAGDSAEASPSLDMEGNDVGVDHPAGVNEVLMLPSRPCSEVLVEDSDCLREDLRPISSKPSSDVQIQIISNTDKNGSSATAVSDITDPPTEKTACNFVINSISDGSVDLIAVEKQKSKYEDEFHESSILQSNSNFENNCVAPGFLTSCSTEMQLSETGNYHKGESSSPNKNGELLDQDDSRHNLVTEQAVLTTSSENDHSGSHLAMYTEDQEWSNVIYGRESSVCSQVDDSVGKISSRSGNLELKEELQRKRSIIDNEFQKRDTKFLRSIKHSAGEALPRRSMRLVTK